MNPTYQQITENFYLWMDHVERHLTGDEARAFFDSITAEERIQLMTECFGPEQIEDDE